jgi:hypothetical protein
MFAIYRRGRYDSSVANVTQLPEELQAKLDGSDEIEFDIPEPVTEDDDDIELLDALDDI